MNILKFLFAILVGLAVGSAVNMSIVMSGSMLIAPPAGVDITNTESMKQSMHLFEIKHFISPWLAHALGTFSGALVAFLIAANHKAVAGYVVGGVFLLGGVAVSLMLPAPVWFITLDLVTAYIPMAWLASQVGDTLRKKPLR